MDKSPPETTVRVVPLGLTLSSFLLVTYTLCIVFGILAPETFHMHSAWAPLLPGFEWLTPRGVLFGAIGAYSYGWYIAVLFVPLYRLFNR
jgi:hypothetical protein